MYIRYTCSYRSAFRRYQWSNVQVDTLLKAGSYCLSYNVVTNIFWSRVRLPLIGLLIYVYYCMYVYYYRCSNSKTIAVEDFIYRFSFSKWFHKFSSLLYFHNPVRVIQCVLFRFCHCLSLLKIDRSKIKLLTLIHPGFAAIQYRLPTIHGGRDLLFSDFNNYPLRNPFRFGLISGDIKQLISLEYNSYIIYIVIFHYFSNMLLSYVKSSIHICNK